MDDNLKHIMVDDLVRGRRPLEDGDFGPRFDKSSAYIMGDSLGANNWPTSTSTFVSIQSEGFHELANAIAGHPLNIVGNVAVGGKTAQHVIDEQLATVIAARPGYALLSAGINDLYTSPQVSGQATYERVATIVRALVQAGITPIWSTITARTYSASYLPEHLDANDRLRRWAAENRCGIFWDAFAQFVDPTSASCEPRTGQTGDTSTPYIHPNNVGAYWLAKKLAAELTRHVPARPIASGGAEDQTNTSAGRSNILTNPIFASTGATAATGTTGVVPTGWKGEWVVRTGTASAALTVVDVADRDTGLTIAKALEATFSGNAAALDEFRFTQDSGFNSILAAGDSVLAQAWMQLVAPANVDRLRVLLMTNNTEQTNWGTHFYAANAAAYPEAFSVLARTRAITVLSNAAGRVDFRVRFNGVGTGTVFRVWVPLVRKGI